MNSFFCIRRSMSNDDGGAENDPCSCRIPLDKDKDFMQSFRDLTETSCKGHVSPQHGLGRPDRAEGSVLGSAAQDRFESIRRA
jgi:hypothetical protein